MKVLYLSKISMTTLNVIVEKYPFVIFRMSKPREKNGQIRATLPFRAFNKNLNENTACELCDSGN